MGVLDYLGKAARAGKDRAVSALTTGAVTTGAAPPPGVNYDNPTASLGADGKVVQNRAPRAPLDGVKPPPAAPTVEVGKPGVVRGVVETGKVAGRFAGAGLGVAAGAYGGYKAGSDISERGANLDNTTDLAGNAALVAGSVLSAPVAVGAGSFLAGKTLGAGAVEAAANTDTGRSVVDYLAGTNKPALANQATLDQVERENPNGKLAEFRRGIAARNGGAPTTAITTPSTPVTAPAAVVAASNAPVTTSAAPRTQRLTSQEVRGLNSGTINAAEYAPGTAGTGFVTSSDGRGARFNAQPVQTAQAESSNTDTALARLRDQASSPERYGQARSAKAAETLLTYETGLAKNATEAAKTKASMGAADATLQDKRAKEFYDQFVNNAFSLPPDDKGVSRPDSAKNNQFLDFARENSPHFQTAEGQASLFALPAQEQNKIISELRAKFVAKDNVETAQNGKAFFQKPGLSNKQVVTTGARESNVGDIPDIGLGNYLYSNLPFTDPNVVTTDRGAVLAEDFIGDPAQEGSYDRREAFTKLLKRGVQRGKVQ